MAAKRAAPLDFAAKYMEFGGSRGKLCHHYAAGKPAVKRWIAEVIDDSAPKTFELADLPKGRPAEMIEERGMDSAEWRVSSMSINEWEMNGDLQRQTKLTVTPVKEQLCPVDVTRWKRPEIKKRAKAETELSVICGDQHAPLHDRPFHEKFLTWLRENKPARGVILGDLLENADVSHWQDRKGEATVKESLDAAYDILRDYIHASPDTDWWWIEGNHDVRVENYNAQNSHKTAGLARAGEDEPVMSMPHLMHLHDLRVRYVDNYPLGKVQLAPKLYVAHGNLAKKGSGATALANLEKRGYNIITGHTHRAGIVFKTTLDEHDHPTTLVGAETGTMLHIEPKSYDLAPDWQNVFATATVWNDGQFNIEMATYSAGSLRWREKRY